MSTVKTSQSFVENKTASSHLREDKCESRFHTNHASFNRTEKSLSRFIVLFKYYMYTAMLCRTRHKKISVLFLPCDLMICKYVGLYLAIYARYNFAEEASSNKHCLVHGYLINVYNYFLRMKTSPGCSYP